jgi:hypothetical protein
MADFGHPEISISQRIPHKEEPTDRISPLPQPSCGGRYWVPTLKDWANRRGFRIRWLDAASIEVLVSRRQLLEFLQSVYGAGTESRITQIRRQVIDDLTDDETYVLVAEEF